MVVGPPCCCCRHHEQCTVILVCECMYVSATYVVAAHFRQFSTYTSGSGGLQLSGVEMQWVRIPHSAVILIVIAMGNVK